MKALFGNKKKSPQNDNAQKLEKPKEEQNNHNNAMQSKMERPLASVQGSVPLSVKNTN